MVELGSVFVLWFTDRNYVDYPVGYFKTLEGAQKFADKGDEDFRRNCFIKAEVLYE